MVGMYLFSVVTALIAAWVMSKTVKQLKAKRLPFVIELPPYRWPRLGGVLRMMWGKSSMFLREAGTVILACSIALWALLYFPRHMPEGSPDYDALIEQAAQRRGQGRRARRKASAPTRASAPARDQLRRPARPRDRAGDPAARLRLEDRGRHRRRVAAREVFVSTLGIVYAVGTDANSHSEPLRTALRDAVDEGGKRSYTPLVGLSLMIFFALACQCHEHARGRPARDPQHTLAAVLVRLHDGAGLDHELLRSTRAGRCWASAEPRIPSHRAGLQNCSMGCRSAWWPFDP